MIYNLDKGLAYWQKITKTQKELVERYRRF
nr:MAG TPA: hypothetical protein [Crassvirales sp.]